MCAALALDLIWSDFATHCLKPAFDLLNFPLAARVSIGADRTETESSCEVLQANECCTCSLYHFYLYTFFFLRGGSFLFAVPFDKPKQVHCLPKRFSNGVLCLPLRYLHGSLDVTMVNKAHAVQTRMADLLAWVSLEHIFIFALYTYIVYIYIYISIFSGFLMLQCWLEDNNCFRTGGSAGKPPSRQRCGLSWP